MSGLLKEIILSKMKNLSTEEIISNAKKNGFSITEKEAEQINNYLRRNRVDPFKEKDRKKMLQELAKITDKNTAKKANRLFKELIKQYGLESLME